MMYTFMRCVDSVILSMSWLALFGTAVETECCSGVPCAIPSSYVRIPTIFNFEMKEALSRHAEVTRKPAQPTQKQFLK
jgi:hypothetical protein